jgi:hypothetical protein
VWKPSPSGSGEAEEELEEFRPVGDNGWRCRFDTCGGTGFGDWTTFAICMTVK